MKDFVALVFVCLFSTLAGKICIIDNFILEDNISNFNTASNFDLKQQQKIIFNLLSIEQIDIFQHFKLII